MNSPLAKVTLPNRRGNMGNQTNSHATVEPAATSRLTSITNRHQMLGGTVSKNVSRGVVKVLGRVVAELKNLAALM